MKTIKALKITSVLQIFFCLFCIASTVCFGISNYQMAGGSDSWRKAFDLANIFIYGWIGNPVAPISFIVCVAIFLRERKQTENRQFIGKKWIWIFIWPIITTIFYLVAMILMVAFTGGV